MSSQTVGRESFGGLRVIAFESRFASSMERLIRSHGGVPTVAPAMREVPLEENTAALDFARALLAGEVDMVIFLTGVGTRALAQIVETKFAREQFIASLSRVTTVARGPKPVAALRELGVRADVTIPEPNTWRELLATLDEHAAQGSAPLVGKRIVVQEYGTANGQLIDGLKSRGAIVTSVPIYRWDLPSDTAPLRKAVTLITAGEAEVALFTTSMQVRYLMRLAAESGRQEELAAAMKRLVLASIGPTTSETLREEYGLERDIEATHPKMAILVKDAAARSREILQKKREAGN